MAVQRNNEYPIKENSVGEILQASTTVAGIAIALLAFLPAVNPAPVVSLSIFAAGAAALWASIVALMKLLSKQGIPINPYLFLPSRSHPEGVVFWAIVFLAIAYVLIIMPEWGNVIAALLEGIARAFRAP